MVKVSPDNENKLSKESAADCFQIRSVAEERLIKRFGTTGIDVMKKVRKALILVLSIE